MRNLVNWAVRLRLSKSSFLPLAVRRIPLWFVSKLVLLLVIFGYEP